MANNERLFVICPGLHHVRWAQGGRGQLLRFANRFNTSKDSILSSDSTNDCNGKITGLIVNKVTNFR